MIWQRSPLISRFSNPIVTFSAPSSWIFGWTWHLILLFLDFFLNYERSSNKFSSSFFFFLKPSVYFIWLLFCGVSVHMLSSFSQWFTVYLESISDSNLVLLVWIADTFIQADMGFSSKNWPLSLFSFSIYFFKFLLCHNFIFFDLSFFKTFKLWTLRSLMFSLFSFMHFFANIII